MDLIQDCDETDLQSSRNSDIVEDQPIFVANESGEVRIQLEGSHTTASTTESDNSKAMKNVKFEDELVSSSEPRPTGNSSKNTSNNEVTSTSSQNLLEDLTESPTKQLFSKNAQLQHTRREKENDEITKHFKQIMDMFDAFTRNLETLELSPATAEEVAPPPYLLSGASNYRILPEGRKIIYELPKGPETDSKRSHVFDEQSQRCVATTTSGLEPLLQTMQCQTSFHEDLSIGQSSFISISACTSKSELPQSLNNYANAGTALAHGSGHDGHPLKKPISELPPAVEEPGTSSFHSIHIDTTSSPSTSVLQRPPLCQRLWDAITDFCAAACLCLQVNRDCIFCLGFFAAFAVSASFLTAFFYRTLIVSPPLLLTPPLSITQDDKGLTAGGLGGNFIAGPL